MTLTDGQEPRKFGTEQGAPPRSRLLRMLAWGGLPGLLFGLVVGTDLATRVPSTWTLPAFLLGLLAPPAAIVAFALLVTAAAGRVAGTSGGASAVGPRSLAMADEMALRGRPEHAAAFYELHAAEHPSEPGAYLRLARLHRDALDRPEEAARWFRLARERAALDEGEERQVARELVDLYRHRLGDPVRAAPELARLAERFAATPEGASAAEELAALKRLLAQRDARGESAP